MKFTCEIDMDNAAFEDAPDAELSSLLKVVSYSVNQGHRDGEIRDKNGNTVGKFAVTK
jgi:hypothetical protein